MIFSIFVLSISLHAQNIVVIVNSENPIVNLSSIDLKNIFTADKAVWDEGNSIQLVDWKIATNVREQFYATILRKSPAIVRKGWVQKIVIGSIYPPAVLSSESEIIHFVATHRWAIAYIEKKELPSTVKTVTLDGRMSNDPAYQLK